MQPFYDPSATAAPAAPSTSIPNEGSSRRYMYKVFLSFRGEDTRRNFVSHLYKELTQKGIHTFKDDHDLKRGDSLTPSLLEAISGSRVAVVVLSEHYASSSWCLKELVEIMECRKRNGQLVVPIFYQVDPSDVKNQRGSFGEDLKKHEKKRKRGNDYEAEMEKWRNALTQVATIAGWDSRDIRDEAIFIENIGRDISDKLECATVSDACDLVAIGSQIGENGKLLEVDREVHMLGIWGMGGIGKTTIAKVLYDKISSQYQARCFLGNVKDKFEKFGATGLRKELLSKVLKERDLDIWPLDEDSSMIKDRLCWKKVLLVLDDVDHIEQLEVLAKHHNWFGLGSIIIITTRDKRLLDEHEVDAMYEVKCLKDDEAHQLFSRHAFKQNQIKKDYWELAIDFLNYAQGLPLALQVLGRFLHNRPIDFWKDELQNLKCTSKPSISDVLKVSFIGLEDNEKDVFLDIACFHNWIDKDKVRQILMGSRLFPDRAFPILIEKSLISIKENLVCMHDLLQDMGRDVVRRESNKPGERSRLWDSKDIRYVLTKKKGTKMIKGISLKLSQVVGQMNLEEDVFGKMDCLRFFRVYSANCGVDDQQKLHLPHCGLQFYTNDLAYLKWDLYPLKSLSLGCCTQNLIELNLSYGKVETLWEGTQEFVNLKFLDLQGSSYLLRIPDLSKAQNITSIDLARCESLVEVHSSIQHLDKLEVLNLWRCKNLKVLPSKLDSNVLTYFSIGQCYKVEKCPEFPTCLCSQMGTCENHSHLPYHFGNLYLGDTAITELPSSMESMSRVKILDVSGCKNLSQLPNWLGNFKSLKTLLLKHTPIKELPQSIENLTLLEVLDLFYCEKLESLSTNLHRLSSLSRINIEHCKRLHSIPKLPPLLSRLEAAHCESLEDFSDNSKDETGEWHCCFDFRGCFKLNENARNNIFSFALSTFQKYSPKKVSFLLPGSEIPRWICEQGVGSSINVQTPSNFAAVICCLVFNGEGLSSRGLSALSYECQFKGDNMNQDHIEELAKSHVFLNRFKSSSNEMVLFNLEKPEALDCVVVNELSFKLSANANDGRRFEMKVIQCGIFFLNEEEQDRGPQPGYYDVTT